MTDSKSKQGTVMWFEMVGQLMKDAASEAALAPDLNVSFVERYTDGAELSQGLVQGIRFDIIGGQPTFRVGAEPNERADVVVEVSASAARELNKVVSNDPAYDAMRQEYLRTGELRVEGDPSRLGSWLEAVHDPIVARTR